MRCGSFGFHKMERISSLSDEVLSTQNGPSSVELVNTTAFVM